MTKKERVLAAIRHQETDKVPKGELMIADGLLDRLLPEPEYQEMSYMARQLAVRERLHMDLVNIHEYPARLAGYDSDGHPIYRSVLGDLYKDTGTSTHNVRPAVENIARAADFPAPDIRMATAHMLDYYRENSDLFLFAQVNGPISSVYWMQGMVDYMCDCMTDTDQMEILTGRVMEFEIQRAKLFLDHGAEAILMADDIGFNSGVMLPPQIMDRLAYPYYRKFIDEVKSYREVPIFFHSDGYIYKEIPRIIESGFDGLQSLQPSAGMDIAKIKAEYGDKLCLMGNVDLDELMPFGTVEQVETQIRQLIDSAGAGGGFILSTCNIFTNSIKTENAFAMYKTAEAYRRG